METFCAGEVSSHPQIAAFLIALRMKGETVDELVGFARAMRRMAVPIDAGLAGETLLDTCGTGGDGANTFNISTVAAFVVAGAGVHVAKHGNRSISSQCGSADLLEAWGIRLDLPPAATARAIREVGIGFLFAPAVHTAMKHAHPVRVDLKMRTVFNLLGPLTNPAGATAQLIGAPSLHAAELMAGRLRRSACGAASWSTARTDWTRSPPRDRRPPGRSATGRWKRASWSLPILPCRRRLRTTCAAATGR